MLLTTLDAAMLRATPQFMWLRRLAAWLIFTVGVVVFATMAITTPEQVCSSESPCVPLPLTSLLIGVFAIVPFLAFAHLRFAAVAVATMSVAVIWHDAEVPSMAAPQWVHVAIMGYAAVSLLLAWLVHRKVHPAAVEEWVNRQPKGNPGGERPARRLVASPVGVLLIIAGLACAGWSVLTQQRMDERQAAAEIVTVRVTEVIDEFTVNAARPDGRVITLDLLDAKAYPVGSAHPMRVDGKGLSQLVAEPYDASPWLALAVILAGLGFALRQRRVSLQTPANNLYTEPQPVTSVWVRWQNDGLHVFAGDAAAYDLPLVRLHVTDRRPEAEGLSQIAVAAGAVAVGAAAIALEGDADLDFDTDSAADADDGGADGHNFGPNVDGADNPDAGGSAPAVRATLYGTPVPGRWCTVSIDRKALVPAAPIEVSHDSTPLNPGGATVSALWMPLAAPGLDEAFALDGPVVSAERPLSSAEAAELSTTDYAPPPHRLNVARMPMLYAYGLTLAMPLALAHLYQKLPGWVPAPAVYAIVAAITAVAVLFGWLTFIRPRVAWNGGGLAIRGINGSRATVLTWAKVSELSIQDNLVFVVSAEPGVYGIPAPKWGRLSAHQLYLRLRNARLRADPHTVPPEGLASGRLEWLLLALLGAAWAWTIAAAAIWVHAWAAA